MMPAIAEVWLVVEPLDMRAGIDGLSQRIQNTLARSPCDGMAYAFRNRRRNRLKLLIWDGAGVWHRPTRTSKHGNANQRGLYYYTGYSCCFGSNNMLMAR